MQSHGESTSNYKMAKKGAYSHRLIFWQILVWGGGILVGGNFNPKSADFCTHYPKKCIFKNANLYKKFPIKVKTWTTESEK